MINSIPRLRLEFALTRRRYWDYCGAVVMIVMFASIGMLSLRAKDLSKEVGLRRERLVTINAAILSAERNAAKVKEVEQKSAVWIEARKIARQLDAPWVQILGDLANATDGDVAVLGFHAEIRGNEVRISAEARNHASMFRFLQNLKDGTALTRPYIATYQDQIKDPQRPVRFKIFASWPGGGASERHSSKD